MKWPAGSARLWLGLSLIPVLGAAQAGDSIEVLETRLPSLQGAARIEVLNRLADPENDLLPATALGYAKEARALAAQTGDLKAEGLALRNMANADLGLSQYGDALDAFKQALAQAEKAGDHGAAYAALNGLGITYTRLSQLAAARDSYSKALSVARATADRKGEARVLHNLGNLERRSGDFGKAVEDYSSAIEVFRTLKDDKSIGIALNNLGIAKRRMGDLPGAVEAHLAALAIDERRGDRAEIAHVSVNLANAYSMMRRYDEAETSIKRSLALYREIGERGGIAAALGTLGNLQGDRGEHERSLPYYQEALKIQQEIGDPRDIADTLGNIGAAYAAMNQPRTAAEYYSRALPLFEKANTKPGIASTLKMMADAEIQIGRYGEAERHLQRALDMARLIGEKDMVRDVYDAQSSLHAAQGNYRQALEDHRLYAATQQEILDRESSAKITEMQAKYDSEKKQRQIEVLQRDNELKALQLKTRRTETYALVAGVVALGAILLLFFRRYLHLLAFWRSKSYVGHYRLLLQVGSGGMGVVYKAAHIRKPTHPVAIKVLREEFAGDPVLQHRLRHEAALIDQLEHPHIVKVQERGEFDQRLFIAMEWLDGRSLARTIREEGRLDLGVCLSITCQLADALAKIHSRGIVHRDVKPENVMLVERDGDPYFVKLLDFDIAKSGSLTKLTQTGVALGTLAYMAPEQITDQAATPASDLYSLGVLAYETLTREQPFFGETPVSVVRSILDATPVPVGRLRGDVPPELDQLIMGLMSKRPEQRPNDSELADRLSEIAARGSPYSRGS